MIVPTYNRRATLPTVLAPLLDDPATSEVIVVIDGCRDGSIELLEEMAADEGRIKPLLIENRGEMGARQAGAEIARGEVVVFLDDDQIASPGIVSGHARHHLGRSNVVVVGYVPTPPPLKRRPGAFAVDLYSRPYERVCAAYEADASTVLRQLYGGNMSLRRADCLRVGLVSEHFGARYHPDQDFGLRCLKAGLGGVFDRTLSARHLYERPLSAFMADARSQGVGRSLIHRLHADVVGALPEDAFAEGLPGPLRFLLRACRYLPLRRVVVALLWPLVRVAGLARLFAVETAAAKLLRRVEQQRGALEIARR